MFNETTQVKVLSYLELAIEKNSGEAKVVPNNIATNIS